MHGLTINHRLLTLFYVRKFPACAIQAQNRRQILQKCVITTVFPNLFGRSAVSHKREPGWEEEGDTGPPCLLLPTDNLFWISLSFCHQIFNQSSPFLRATNLFALLTAFLLCCIRTRLMRSHNVTRV